MANEDIELPGRKKAVLKRACLAYACALGIPAVVLTFSYSQGANWKPVLVGLPVYLVIIGSITYQFTKELRSFRREQREGEPSDGESRQ